MENKHTSLELSKKLAEAGCKLESKKVHIFYNYMNKSVGTVTHLILNSKKYRNATESTVEDLNGFKEIAPAYDILNDICCKYAKEFFSCQDIPECNHFGRVGNYIPFVHSQYILYLLQKGEKQKAEDYIWEHTIFNPKNKGGSSE